MHDLGSICLYHSRMSPTVLECYSFSFCQEEQTRWVHAYFNYYIFVIGVNSFIQFFRWLTLNILGSNPAAFFNQKTKRAPKVETGTRTVDASMDEWLEVGIFSLFNQFLKVSWLILVSFRLKHLAKMRDIRILNQKCEKVWLFLAFILPQFLQNSLKI